MRPGTRRPTPRGSRRRFLDSPGARPYGPAAVPDGRQGGRFSEEELDRLTGRSGDVPQLEREYRPVAALEPVVRTLLDPDFRGELADFLAGERASRLESPGHFRDSSRFHDPRHSSACVGQCQTVELRDSYRPGVDFDAKEFGRRVATARVWSGLTPKEVAGRMGASAETVYRIERGERSTAPRRAELRLLAEILEQPEEWLMAGSTPPWTASGEDQPLEDVASFQEEVVVLLRDQAQRLTSIESRLAGLESRLSNGASARQPRRS